VWWLLYLAAADGWYFDMSSTINATTVGVGGIVATADNSGILVLQTASTTALTISAAQGVTLAGTLGVTGITTVAAGTALLPALTTTGDTNTGFWFPAADTIAASTGGTERIRVTSGGNVGIACTPSRRLSVQYDFAKTDTTSRAIAVFKSNDASNANEMLISSTGAATQASRVWSIQTGEDGVSNAGALSLQPSGGNVGIGTTSPGAKLAFSTDADTNGYDVGKIRLYDNGSTIIYGFGVSSTQLNYRTGQSSDQHVWYAGTTERMRIDTGGNLIVGGTTATARINSFSSSADLYSGTNVTTAKFAVSSGGTVFAVSTSISSISDVRYKENIRDLDVGLDKIMALKPRLFDWKEGIGADTKNARGFIAQEFEQVFPDLIDEWKEAPPEGEEPYKSVRQDLFPVLVSAIQELKAIIDTQSARITALETA